MLTLSPKGPLLFADPEKMHTGLNVAIRTGLAYENIPKGPTPIASSAYPDKVTSTVFVFGAIGFDCVWDIPISLMQLNHDPACREYLELNTTMSNAYGEHFAPGSPVTAILFNVPIRSADVTKFNSLRRTQVFSAISTERLYQYIKWEEKREDAGHVPTEGDYLTYMRSYLQEAEDQLTREAGSLNALDTLRKVVTLGVACLENHGCPDRQDKDFKRVLDNQVEYKKAKE
jgi:hypothetical protein